MKRREEVIIAAVVLAACTLVGLILLSAWHHHCGASLTNGYSYWYSDDGPLIELVSEERMKSVIKRDYWIPRVGPRVKSYRVYKNVITGYVSMPSDAGNERSSTDIRPYDPSATGYFLINLANDRICTGLSKTAWLAELRQFGINEEPVLYKPSMFDRYNGHTKAE